MYHATDLAALLESLRPFFSDVRLLHPATILEAENGEQCLNQMREHAGDIALILLDINMPQMDGFEVLNHMNRNHSIEDVPVIMISSEESDEYIRRREKNTSLMVAILSQIVEFRNGESALHVQHIRILTECILEWMNSHTEHYHLTDTTDIIT